MLRRMLNPLFPRFSIPSFLLPFFLFFSNRPPYLSEGTESSSKLHADHRARFDFNGCHHEYHLEMLIPIIRPTIVSGNGLDWVQGTPIPLIRYVSRRKFRTNGRGRMLCPASRIAFFNRMSLCESTSAKIHPSIGLQYFSSFLINVFQRNFSTFLWNVSNVFLSSVSFIFVENRCVQVS